MRRKLKLGLRETSCVRPKFLTCHVGQEEQLDTNSFFIYQDGLLPLMSVSFDSLVNQNSHLRADLIFIPFISIQQ